MALATGAGRRIAVATGVVVAGVAAAGAAPATTHARLPNGSFELRHDGVTTHYEVHGSGPVLMALTNSWGLSLEGLREMYRPLEKRLTMVYFDPRGLGGSSPARSDADRGMAAVREDFDALRRHLGLARVAAIGWSNGAMNLILLASEHPDTLSAAIFVHGVAYLGPEDEKQMAAEHADLFRQYGAFMKQVSAEGLSAREQTRLLRRFWVETYFPHLCADPETGKGLVEGMFAQAQMSWPHARVTNADSKDWDVRDRLSRITARSLVIAGAHDLLPPERVRALHEGIRGSRFLVFEKSGHFSPLEEPEAFRKAVWEFLGVNP